MLDEKFWNHFKKEFWERRAVAFTPDSGFPCPKIPESKIFDLVVQKAKTLRAGKAANLRVYKDGICKTEIAEIDDFLPKPEDRSFLGYYLRCHVELKAKNYGIVVNHLQEFDPEFWEKMCQYLQPLFREVGVPQCEVETFLFLGDYWRTPFAVHVDTTSVFHFPLLGQKVIRTWNNEYVQKNPELKGSYTYTEKHIKNSKLIESGPGGCLYWPSKLWHIAESSGEFKVSYGVAFRFGEVHGNLVSNTLLRKAQELGITLKDKYGPFKDGPAYRLLPFDQDGQLGLLRARGKLAAQHLDQWAQIASAHETQVEVQEAWLKHLSGYGFTRVPPVPAPRRLGPESLLQVNAKFPILTYVFRNGDCCVACRGASFVEKKGRWLQQLAQLMNTGEQIPVSKISRQFSTRTLTRTQIIKVLRKLHKVGAFKSHCEKPSRISLDSEH